MTELIGQASTIAGLTGHAWITVGVIALLIGVLVFTRIPADVVLVGGVTVLLLTGVLDASEALSGLANEGVVTVAALYIVVAGMRATGATSLIVHTFLGQPRSLLGAQFKMLLPVTTMSAFMNNTPVVAMFMPAINDWARKFRLPISKLMIPLSYASILGGCCTLIGTSTNIVVNYMLAETDHPALGMFDITRAGLPCAVVGLAYLLIFSRWLLPDRQSAVGLTTDPREYTIEMVVEPGSQLAGKTIEQAGLRHLPGMFLAEVDRGGEILPAVSPTERLQENDRLVFVGIVESVLDLQKIRGLKPATDQVFKLDAPRTRRTLIEAVVSNSCPLVGQTVREGRFRTVYNAAIIAVARNGERIQKKIGDIILRPGDTLLLEAHPSFVNQQRNSRDFFLVSQVENSMPIRHERAFLAIGILALMVTAVTLDWLSILQASLLAGGIMVATRCCTSTMARRSVDWQILLAFAASLGIGKAVQVTGLAESMAVSLIDWAGEHPFLVLGVVYGVTMVLAQFINHAASAVLVFPLAMATAERLGVSTTPFVVTIMLAASFSFSSPVGYQTNLMVYNAGGYHFRDFIRVGLPLDLLLWVTAVLIVPYAFPFHPPA